MPVRSEGVYKNTRSRAKARLEKAQKAKEDQRRRGRRIEIKTASVISDAITIKKKNSFGDKAIALLQSIESTKPTREQIENCRKCVKTAKTKKDKKKCKTVCKNVDENDIHKLTEEDIKKIKSQIAKSKKFKDERRLKF